MILVLTATLADRAKATSRGVGVRTLSTRANLVSGGDALVGLTLPRGFRLGSRAVRIQLNSRSVKSAFRRRADGRIIGLVRGLRKGRNVLRVLLPGRGARLRISNHPRGGPIFAGRQVQPWFCATESFGLSPPHDEQCDADPVVTYRYKSALTGSFAAYDPADPPLDVATTTTDQGLTVPYIVRLETGAQDRGIYQTAVLADPARRWRPWTPQPAWNHKLMVPFGGSCGPEHRQTGPAAIPVFGVSVSVLDDAALSRGFAVTSSGLNTFAQNCNEVVSAEALMMQKERIRETLGPIRYTIGEGCSGGSIQQHNIAAAYPGLLDGITPMCSFPDTWSTVTDGIDCSLLIRYFTQSSPLLWPLPAQHALVEGKANIGSSCLGWNATFAAAFDPQNRGPLGLGIEPLVNCGVPDDQVYNPQSNPDGVRCSIADYQSSIFGTRAVDGFGERPLDNVGVQYGLAALTSGQISPEQFVDLNANVGGLDIDGEYIRERMAMSPQVSRILYRAGRVTDARQLRRVAILDLRGQDNEEVHQSYTSYVMRARLDAANGTHANQVIWTGPLPVVGRADLITQGFLAMDRWLTAVDSDRSRRPLAAKILRNKPTDLVDTCWVGDETITDAGRCRELYPYYANPRIAAGGPITDDIRKCALKPLNRADYPVAFTDDQWTRLQAAFPIGVCDWTARGIGQGPSRPWTTFADGPGGRPLGPPPRSRDFRR